MRDDDYQANLDGMVLRQVLMFSPTATDSFSVGDYPWATYVFFALPGTDGTLPDLYMQCCHRLGMTPADAKSCTIIGLWGFPADSPADRGYIVARNAGNADLGIEIGQALAAAPATVDTTVTAGRKGYEPSPPTTVIAAGGSAVIAAGGSGGQIHSASASPAPSTTAATKIVITVSRGGHP